MARYESYVICTTPRSGSTLLCKLLAATGKSGNPESWFHTPSVENWVRHYLERSLDSFETLHAALATVFQTVREQGTNGTGIFGLRMQRRSFNYFIQQTDVLYPGLASDRERFQAAFGETLFIYLSREDKLDQAISYAKATQTGLWHRAVDGSELERLSEPQEPRFDAELITGFLEEVTAGNAEWEEWFEREGIEPLRVSYEALAGDPQGNLLRILDDLGLGFPDGLRVEPGVAKLADGVNREWKRRYIISSAMLNSTH